MPSVSVSGNPVGGGIQMANDGRGIILPVETASNSKVFRVRGGDGIGISGSLPTDSVQE